MLYTQYFRFIFCFVQYLNLLSSSPFLFFLFNLVALIIFVCISLFNSLFNSILFKKKKEEAKTKHKWVVFFFYFNISIW